MEPPQGALADRLRALGVDPDQLAPNYLATQWAQAVQVYREHLFPTALSTEGNRKLGHALGVGYGTTFSGKVLLATFPLLSPMQFLRRWPRFVRMGRTDVTLNVTETGDRSVSIHSIDTADVPMELNLGLFDFCFERLGEQPSFRVEGLGPGEAIVHCAW